MDGGESRSGMNLGVGGSNPLVDTTALLASCWFQPPGLEQSVAMGEFRKS